MCLIKVHPAAAALEAPEGKAVIYQPTEWKLPLGRLTPLRINPLRQVNHLAKESHTTELV